MVAIVGDDEDNDGVIVSFFYSISRAEYSRAKNESYVEDDARACIELMFKSMEGETK